ncbi:MAG: hypothetical protein K6G65_07985 [Lachnospiraceae bacterium]|nr:hypothetical protein [Lachnospiraceae bacterium]
MLIGLISGMPVGAMILSLVVKDRQISKEEGEFLLGFCNNLSPAFLLNYVCIEVLGMAKYRFLLYGLYLLSGYIASCLVYFRFVSSQIRQKCPLEHCHAKVPSIITSFEIMDTSIMYIFEILIKTCGLLMLFSIVSNFFSLLFPSANHLKILITGFLEVTTGMYLLKSTAFDLPLKFLFIIFFCTLTGLAQIAQTLSVMTGSTLSIRGYLKTKALQCAMLCTLWAFIAM